MWEHDFEAARLTDQECDVCARLRLTERGENPNLVAELSTGYVVLGDDQYIRGYTVLICKHHATELFDLEPDFRAKFLEEMALTAQAVEQFKAGHGPGICNGYDIYCGICEAIFLAQSNGMGAKALTDLEEMVSRCLTYRFHEYDIPGTILY